MKFLRALSLIVAGSTFLLFTKPTYAFTLKMPRVICENTSQTDCIPIQVPFVEVQYNLFNQVFWTYQIVCQDQYGRQFVRRVRYGMTSKVLIQNLINFQTGAIYQQNGVQFKITSTSAPYDFNLPETP